MNLINLMNFINESYESIFYYLRYFHPSFCRMQ